MTTVRKQIVQMYVDRVSHRWIVLDLDGVYWAVPAGEQGWNRRQPAAGPLMIRACIGEDSHVGGRRADDDRDGLAAGGRRRAGGERHADAGPVATGIRASRRPNPISLTRFCRPPRQR